MEKWTRFWDMNSGGGLKEEPYAMIYIEAPEEEARIIFYNRFGHSASRVSCTCCGEDYSVTESDSLAEATAWHRGCFYDEELKQYVEKPGGRFPYLSLLKYCEKPDVLTISAFEIKPEEREGYVPEQGYVWQD